MSMFTSPRQSFCLLCAYEVQSITVLPVHPSLTWSRNMDWGMYQSGGRESKQETLPTPTFPRRLRRLDTFSKLCSGSMRLVHRKMCIKTVLFCFLFRSQKVKEWRQRRCMVTTMNATFVKNCSQIRDCCRVGILSVSSAFTIGERAYWKNTEYRMNTEYWKTWKTVCRVHFVGKNSLLCPAGCRRTTVFWIIWER